VLLKEYAEIGLACRQIENLTRTGLNLFLIVQGGIVTYVATKGLLGGPQVLFFLFGTIFSYVTWHTTRRSQAYGRIYQSRARNIETALGMRLYSLGKANIQREFDDVARWLSKLLGWLSKLLPKGKLTHEKQLILKDLKKTTNKDLLAFVACLTTFVYFVLLVFNVVCLFLTGIAILRASSLLFCSLNN
jgi:hypothetical protein